MSLTHGEGSLSSLSISSDLSYNDGSWLDVSSSTDDIKLQDDTLNLTAKYSIGICAMDKKAKSKPMQQILARLPRHLFRIVNFGDELILNQPITEWPTCDALIAFFSKGFPLDKAKEYVELRQPVVVNDIWRQDLLMDRRDVYRVLKENDIPLPRHVFVNRDEYRGQPPSEVIEGEDFIEVNGVRINKPFVEKPVDAENHRIYIYYPTNAGGGCKKLFRKIGNRSSEFDPSLNKVRTKGSYVYEEFLATQGTDVKVYTVGPRYAHAEARKSPVLDGRVLRDVEGKEVRYPVILSTQEKEIAYKVCRAFGQTICGFDILRVHEADTAYVCDVNGWSFVKNSEKYYDDCSMLLARFLEHSLEGFGPGLSTFLSQQKTSRENSNKTDLFPSNASIRCLDDVAEFEELDDFIPSVFDPPTSNYKSTCDGSGGENGEKSEVEELRCILAVIRHGDRTPKQKMKMLVCHPAFLKYYEDRISATKSGADLKLKAISDLQKLLEVSKELVRQYDTNDAELLSFLEEREKEYGEERSDKVAGYRMLREVLQRWQLCGINRKVQLKPKEFFPTTDGSPKRPSKLLLIMKWGGDLTHSGAEQAERLGQQFRQEMYPGGEGGLIRLHSTFRHDLKIYTSEEGRVQKTAASFAKGLLALEGDIIPILVGLVLKSKNAEMMLDPSGSSVHDKIAEVKKRLHAIIHSRDSCKELLKSDSHLVRSVVEGLERVGQPLEKMEVMQKLLNSLKEQLTTCLQEKRAKEADKKLRPPCKDKDRDRDRPKDKDEKKANLGRGVRRRPSDPRLGRSQSVSSARMRRFTHSHSFPTEEIEEEHQTTTEEDEAEEIGKRGIKKLRKQLRNIVVRKTRERYETTGVDPCGRETLEMMRERWAKLARDFYNRKTDLYDLSKIPDIHDCIRYDALHNVHLRLKNVAELLSISSTMAQTLVPQEYGIDVSEKMDIGSAMCNTLLEKIQTDLDVARGFVEINHATGTPGNVATRLNPNFSKEHGIKSKNRAVRTRLYFTSESHLYTLLNVLRYGYLFDCGRNENDTSDNANKGPISQDALEWTEGLPELCYMTHFVFRVFERKQFQLLDPRRFRVEIWMSPGADQNPLRAESDMESSEYNGGTNPESSSALAFAIAPLKLISRDDITCQQFVDYLGDIIKYASKSESDKQNLEEKQYRSSSSTYIV